MQLLNHFHKLSIHPKNASELKGLILQLAIQGKLTAIWRKQNPKLISGINSAENLLKRINLEKARLIKEKKIKREKPLSEITEKEFPFTLPKNWTWCSHLNILKFQKYPLCLRNVFNGLDLI